MVGVCENSLLADTPVHIQGDMHAAQAANAATGQYRRYLQDTCMHVAQTKSCHCDQDTGVVGSDNSRQHSLKADRCNNACEGAREERATETIVVDDPPPRQCDGAYRGCMS